VLFTFPSRYLFTIGRQRVFSLTPWSAQFHAKLHLDRVTQEFPRRTSPFRLRAFHPLWSDFPFASSIDSYCHIGLLQPHWQASGLGSSAFARRYSRNHFRFLFLWLLRCFTSPGVALQCAIFVHTPTAGYEPGQVTPFGNPRVKAYLPLSVAYRSLSRPSSPVGTKASIMCPS
jgi:hypothetical protein